MTDAGGQLTCWGDNRAGQLGLGTLTDELVPRTVALTNVDMISAGGFTTCAIASGELSCWGDNSDGELGLGDLGVGTERLTPVRVGGEADWTAVTVGHDVACGVRGGGDVYCWGDNSSGTVGLDRVDLAVPIPTGPLQF